MTTIPGPDGLREAKRIKAAYEAIPRPCAYNGSQAGDVRWLEAQLDAAWQRHELRQQARQLIARRIEEGWAYVLEQEGQRQQARGNGAAVTSLPQAAMPAARAAKPTAYQLRIRQAQRLHREGLPAREIASRMAVTVAGVDGSPRLRPLTLQTVRSYLALPDETHVTKPSENRSTRLNGSSEGQGSSSRKAMLKERVRRLRDEGMVRAAIADRLGKTDATVGRYLAELKREEAA